MSIFPFLRKKIVLEKYIFLPKKCIYFISYRNEHPVYNLYIERDSIKKIFIISQIQKIIFESKIYCSEDVLEVFYRELFCCLKL